LEQKLYAGRADDDGEVRGVEDLAEAALRLGDALHDPAPRLGREVADALLLFDRNDLCARVEIIRRRRGDEDAASFLPGARS
jgi:hypothetical protein